MEKEKKKAAAIAAVMNYIQEEEVCSPHQTVAISAPLYHQLMGLYQHLKQIFPNG